MSRVLCAALAIAVLGLVAAGGYWFGSSRSHAPSPGSPAAAPQPDRKVLYWYDPMFPQQKFDKPGKSPFMDMSWCRSTPTRAVSEGTVSISPRVVQNLGVRTAEARRGTLASQARRGRQRRLERALRRPRAGARRTASSSGSTCARRSTRCAPGDPLVEILFPSGRPRRRSTSRCGASPGPTWNALAARRARAALAPRHDGRADRGRRARRAKRRRA